ncbi:MAG: metallopeptidase TldD-related protein, partial [Desulfobacca sp.]|nr:metallopeptidase TldD-related protein [Desulfobacca sp.]
MILKDLRPLLANLVAEMEKTVPYAAALAQETEGERLYVDSREARAEALDRQQGVVLTVFTGRSFLEYALSGLSAPDFCSRLSQGAQALVRAAVDEGLVEPGLIIDPGTSLTRDFAVFPVVEPAEVSLPDKMADLVNLRDQLQSGDPQVVNATAVYSQMVSRELFVNRARRLYQELPRVQIVAQIVLRQDQRTARLHTGHCYQGGYEHARLAPEKIARLREDARRILNAPRLTPGTYDCLFSPDFAGIFAHEAFGHGTEADLFLQHRSRGQDYLGQLVAS